ncbi:hypothetical protein PF006_g14069, partial [Phytophthora fragariae]
QNVRLTSQLKDFEKCRPPQVGGDNTLASSLLARDVQVHYWNHCRSCFKKTRFEMQWRDYYGAQRGSDQEKESDEDILLRTRTPATSNWAPVNDVDGVRRDTDESFDDSIPFTMFSNATEQCKSVSTRWLRFV